MALSKTEEKIYELLKSNELYRGEKGIYTIFPQKYLILKSGKSERTVRGALKGLEEQGYIHRELDTEIHVMLFYFPNEDFAGRHIHDRYESCPVSTESLEENCPVSTESLEENCPVSTESLENCPVSTESLEENCPVSTESLEENCPVSTESLENCPVSTESLENCTSSTESLENCTHSTDGLDENYANYRESAQSEFSLADDPGKFTQVIKNLKSTVKNSILQNSPVNNEMIRNSDMNDLYPAYVSGKPERLPTVVREKHGKAEQVISYVSFSYDNTVDLERLNKKGRFNITAYDRRVYNAVSTLFINGRKTISLLEIFNVMTGYAKTNPSTSQMETLEKSLGKLKSIRVYIDLTDEVNNKMIQDKQPLIDAGILKNHSDKIKKAVVEDNMLHFKKCNLESDQGKEFKVIQIIGEPALLSYNKAKKTLLTIPMEYIGLEGQNSTDKTIAFQDYLLMRIFGYKNGKLRENKILYDTMYRDSGYEKPQDSKGFIRDRETIVRMMEEWKRKGLITEFSEVKEGRSYTGLVFYMAEPSRIE